MKEQFIRAAVALAVENVRANKGGPFGAIVVKDGSIVGDGVNSVVALNDPTAHAEVMAIRSACAMLRTFNLTGCELYASCEPCPMCLSAIYWARLDRFFFAAEQRDAEEGGFDDALICRELTLNSRQRSIPGELVRIESSVVPFETWRATANKIPY